MNKRGTRVLILNNSKKIAKSKRSISSVVATILLILIAILAILLFWFMLRGFLKKSASGIETSCLTLDLEIEKAQVNNSFDILYVNIKRNPGAGNLSGIRFKITNNSESVLRDKNASVRELETRIFSFDDIGNVSYIKRVDIAGIVSLGGEVKICRIADSSKVFENYGGSYTLPSPQCEEDEDCGQEELINNYCIGDDVYGNYSLPSCEQGSCNVDYEQRLEEECAFECVSGVCTQLPPEIYVPNQTGNNAWYGGAIELPVTLGVFKDTVYTSAELDKVSIDDNNNVSISASGLMEDSCFIRNQTSDCTSLSLGECLNYYEPIGEIACQVGGDEACVAGESCYRFPGHEMEFKINEDRSSIKNISIRVVSFGDRVNDGNARTLSVYNWTSSSYIQYSTSACASGISNVKCNLTAVIKDPLNFVNSTGYLDFILYDSSAGSPNYKIINYYVEVNVTS